MAVSETSFDALGLEAPPATPADAPAAARAARLRTIRRVAAVAYVAAFAYACVRDGVPLDRVRVVLWVCAALTVVSIGRPWHTIPRLLADWLPFTAALVLYDFSRGAADSLGVPVHFTPQIDVDKFLFAGTVPTVWLQHHLITPGYIRWYEVPVTLVYLSHFIVPVTVAAVFWVRDRARFVSYAQRFVTLAFVGCATYIAFPAAPPWLGAEHGLLPELVRSSGRGLSLLHLSTASKLLANGQATANPVAAVPSLHAAYATLVVLALWPHASSRWRAVLAAYPVAMGFALVLTAEHYVADVVLGWGYAFAVVALWRWIDAARTRRRTAAVSGAGSP